LRGPHFARLVRDREHADRREEERSGERIPSTSTEMSRTRSRRACAAEGASAECVDVRAHRRLRACTTRDVAEGTRLEALLGRALPSSAVTGQSGGCWAM